MAIKERKQVTGTTAQINAYAGHEGQLVWDKTKKKVVGMSGTAGTNYPMASERHQHSIANVTDLQKYLDEKANSSHTHTIANVTGLQDALNAASTQASNAIPKTGDRGPLAGYETVTVESESDVSVTKDTPDVFLTSGAITAPSFSSSEWGECWTKVGALLSTSPLVTLNDHWIWSGGVVPTLHQYDLVVFNKTRGLGTATVVVRR